MAASDAKPFPLKNQAYRVYFPLLDADGDLVGGMAGLDSEVSKDGATFANCTNEATEILTIVHDVNDTTNAVTAADATNQATLNTLLNEIKTDYNAHRVSTTFHDAADSTNVVASADATDAATSVTLANEIKADYNAHRSQSDVHPHDDSANAVSSADATDEASCITLANEIKTDYNAHLTATAGSGMAYLDLTQTEMNADTTAIVVKSSTTGAKTTPIVLYPAESTDIPVNLTAIGGVVQSLTDFKDLVDTGYDPSTHLSAADIKYINGTNAGADLLSMVTCGYDDSACVMQADLTHIHGTALTETAGQLAAAFKKLFDVATPLLVASDVMVGTDAAALATTALSNVTWTDAKAAEITAIDVLTEGGGSGDLAAIKTQVDAILDLERESGVVTVTDAETTLYEDAAPTKNKLGIVVKIDMAALEAADTFVVKEKYKDESGGAYQVVDEVSYTGVQTNPLRIIALTPYRYGAIITMQRTAGTNRSIEWESFVEE